MFISAYVWVGVDCRCLSHGVNTRLLLYTYIYSLYIYIYMGWRVSVQHLCVFYLYLHVYLPVRRGSLVQSLPFLEKKFKERETQLPQLPIRSSLRVAIWTREEGLLFIFIYLSGVYLSTRPYPCIFLSLSVYVYDERLVWFSPACRF